MEDARQLWWLISDAFGLVVCVVAALGLAAYATKRLADRVFGGG